MRSLRQFFFTIRSHKHKKTPESLKVSKHNQAKAQERSK